MIFVSVSSALSACSYSDYTENCLCALLKPLCASLVLIKKKVFGTGAHTWWYINARDRPS